MAVSACLISKSALVTNVAEVAVAITSRPRPGDRARRRSATSSATSPTARRSRSWPTCASGSSPRSSRSRRPGLADRRSGDLLARIVGRHRDARGLLRPGHRRRRSWRPSWRSSAGIAPRRLRPVSSGSSLVAFLVVAGRRPAARRRAGCPRAAGAGAASRPRGELSAMLVDEVQRDRRPRSRSTGRPTTASASWRSAPSSIAPADRLALVRSATSAAAGHVRRAWPAVTVLAIGIGLVGAGRLDGVYLRRSCRWSRSPASR